MILNPGPTPCHFKSSYLRGRSWCKENCFILLPAAWEDGRLPLQSPFNIPVQAWVFIKRERKTRTKRSGGGAVDMQAVSLLVLIWIFNIGILELVSASQISAVGWSVSANVVVKAVSCTIWNFWCLQYVHKETVNIYESFKK